MLARLESWEPPKFTNSVRVSPWLLPIIVRKLSMYGVSLLRSAI